MGLKQKSLFNFLWVWILCSLFVCLLCFCPFVSHFLLFIVIPSLFCSLLFLFLSLSFIPISSPSLSFSPLSFFSSHPSPIFSLPLSSLLSPLPPPSISLILFLVVVRVFSTSRWQRTFALRGQRANYLKGSDCSINSFRGILDAISGAQGERRVLAVLNGRYNTVVRGYGARFRLGCVPSSSIKVWYYYYYFVLYKASSDHFLLFRFIKRVLRFLYFDYACYSGYLL